MHLVDGLLATARRLPDKAALVCESGEVTYGALAARVAAAAAGLRAAGLVPGDRVALLLSNTPRFAEALYATLLAGGVAVPLNPQFTAVEIEGILRDAGARVVVTAAGHAATAAGLRGTLPDLDVVLVEGDGDLPEGTRSWAAATAGEVEVPAEVPVVDARPGLPDGVPADLALLQYTSGTTGEPKGAMLTHGQLAANQRQMQGTRLRVGERDVVYTVLPLFHIYALNVALGLSLTMGATLLLAERFDPRGALATIARHRASILVGAPPMYLAWAQLPDMGAHDLGSVRIAVSGAAPLPAEVLARTREVLGLDVWEGYGLTEAAPTVTSTAMGGAPVPGSVGRPLPEVELRLVDDLGQQVAPGELGEVAVRGPNVFAGYWRRRGETAEVLSADGWLATGDVGYLDGRGDLRLVERKRDLVIVSGFNVFPSEVEAALRTHAAVADAAVVGVPHPTTGEAVAAYVVAAPGATPSEDELLAHCRTRLARYKLPESVTVVDALPLLPTGKVKRRTLRESS